MTQLLYLKNMETTSSIAKVQAVIHENEKIKIILDETIFYPQGGGQPTDKGTIESKNGIFEVSFVTKEGNQVAHYGIFTSGNFIEHEAVSLNVNKELRIINTKNHSAGHLVDYALKNLNLDWKPIKGYHFPEGCYVEYQTNTEISNKEELLIKIEQEINNIIKENKEVIIAFVDNDISKRSVAFDGYPAILCGGTHINKTGDLKKVKIKKLKNEKGNIRVSYAIDQE